MPVWCQVLDWRKTVRFYFEGVVWKAVIFYARLVEHDGLLWLLLMLLL
jgi:hypothetical protein